MGGKNFDHFDDLICFDRGVEAIIFCLRSAFETPPKILLPTLFCGQTESTMRQHGLKTAFYPIDSEMNPQIEGLQEVIRIEKPDAVLVCDYFGWSASNFDELKSLFWREHLFSIRDCCHNPHSYNRGESDFDAVIFSWRKCYPVGFGGGLLWEKGNPNKEHEYQSAHSLQQLFSSGLRRWFVGAAKKFLPLALIGILKSRLSIRPKKFIDLRFAKPKIKNSLER